MKKLILSIAATLSFLFSLPAFSQEVPGIIPYRKGDKWGYCDESRRILVPTIFDAADLPREGMALVTVNGKSGFLDEKGNSVIQIKYDYASPFSEGLAIYREQGKF